MVKSEYRHPLQLNVHKISVILRWRRYASLLINTKIGNIIGTTLDKLEKRGTSRRSQVFEVQKFLKD